MTMFKKEIIFGVLGSLVVIFLMFYYVWQYKSINRAFLQNQQNKQNVASSSVSLLNLTAEEAKNHATSSDCWMIINGNIYDVSNYDVNHPGGAYRIDSYCGKDATRVFATMDGRGSHSSFANQLLNGMLLGKLNGQADSQKVQEVKNKNAVMTSKFDNEKEEDEDD